MSCVPGTPLARTPVWVAALSLAALAFAPGAATAGFYTFISGSTTTTGSGSAVPVNVQAVIATNGTSVTITLTNLQTDIHTAGQAISGFEMHTTPQNLSPVTLNSVVGQLVDVNDSGQGTLAVVTARNQQNGNVTYGPGAANTTYSGAVDGVNMTPLDDGRWSVVGENPPDLIALGNSQPDHLVLGPGSGPNGLSWGSNLQDQFSPYFSQSVTLNLTVGTPITDISSATFRFGTSSGEGSVTVTRYDTAAPAPPALTLLGTGAAFAGLFGWRRRKAASA
ncbi:MAG TPA: hypothetical protein VGF55_31880 [Gemmataceae bacterium]|jgi:hypothetical protein